MNGLNPKVDDFIDASPKWRKEFSALRKIVSESGLTEDVKWGVPCYTLQDKNVVLIHGFKEYCALLFIKGALLRDAAGLLIQQTENVQAGRQMRFTDVADILAMEPHIKDYIREAIAVEKAGLKIPLPKDPELKLPEEFQMKLDENRLLKNAFDALTPGRKRAYSLFFSAPKQAMTRVSRIEKCVPLILDGKGLND
ncbi:MAG: DUF1801 domain-containing protein [bacterium]